MDLRHQSSAMCIIMLGGEDTHPWSATKVRNPIPATIPVTKKQPTRVSDSGYPGSVPVPSNSVPVPGVGRSRSKELDRKSELVLRSTYKIFEWDRNNWDRNFYNVVRNVHIPLVP